MAAFPCPHCGHALVTDADAEADARLERCPSCDGTLLIAYRYRLIAAHGKVSGGLLYQAIDDGFDERVAVLFVEDQDPEAVERFIEGSRLFADLGGRGLVKIHELAAAGDRRPYVVMAWLDGGTLDRVVERRGALEQAVLLGLVGDLLTGLSKAHRSMPAIVHGHVHPGKIGFVNGSGEIAQAVLFGFEWAKQVSAQASRLADSFVRDVADEDDRGPTTDLRQLGVAIYYAATGEWLGDRELADQRARARAQVPGPLGRLIDRLLGAGVDGYKTAVEAAIDFEQLMRGVDRFQAPTAAPIDRSDERIGTAWADDDDDHDDDNDDDEVALEQPRRALAVTPAQHSSATPASTSAPRLTSAGPRKNPAAVPSAKPQAEPDWAAWAAQRQSQALAQARAQAQAQAKPKTNPGRAISIFIGVGVAFTACIGMIIAESDDAQPPPEFRPRVEQVVAEPTPTVEPIPAPPELAPAELAPAELAPPASLAGVFHYEGKVSGPPSFAGLAPGEACDVWVEPNSGGLNCRWFIDCGTPRRRIYGGGSVGYSRCEIGDVGQPLSAEDDEDDAPDGAFLADLASSEPMIVVSDRWILPAVHVIISIETGGPTSDIPPEVPQAPRLANDEINRRIAAEEFPAIEPGVLADW